MNFTNTWKKKYIKRFIMDYPAIDSDYREAVKDFIQETINSLLDELEIEKASIPCNQRGIGFNDAVDEFNSKLERFRGWMKKYY